MSDSADLAAELSASDAQTRLSAIARIAEAPDAALDQAALDALVRCVGSDSKAVQRRAADAIARFAIRDARITGLLYMLLNQDDQRARWGAAYTLGLVDDALDLRALPALLEALSAGDGDVRWAAAELMVRLGEENREQVRGQLLGLAREGSLNGRKMALYCLRDLGDGGEEILALAENVCADRHTLLKLAALSLVSRMPDHGDRAASIARRLLETDPDPGVRRSAAVALGHIGNRSDGVLAALRRASVSEADLFLKRSAQRALKRLGIDDAA